MKNVTFKNPATESQIMNVVFDACRSNESRQSKWVFGMFVEFVELPEGHLAMVYHNGLVVGTAHVDEFDC